MHSLGRLSEVKLLESEIFQIRLSVRLVKLRRIEKKMHLDHTIKKFDDTTFITQKKRIT